MFGERELRRKVAFSAFSDLGWSSLQLEMVLTWKALAVVLFTINIR